MRWRSLSVLHARHRKGSTQEVMSSPRPMGATANRWPSSTSRLLTATLFFAVCCTLISPTCKGRFGDELEAIKRNARCGGPARTPDIVKFALRSKYMRRRTLSVLHARHRDQIPSRDASGERCRVPEPHGTKKKKSDQRMVTPSNFATTDPESHLPY